MACYFNSCPMTSGCRTIKEHLIRFKYNVPEGYLCRFGPEDLQKKYQAFRHDVYEFCPLEEIFEDRVRKLAILHNIISVETITRYDLAKGVEESPDKHDS